MKMTRDVFLTIVAEGVLRGLVWGIQQAVTAYHLAAGAPDDPDHPPGAPPATPGRCKDARGRDRPADPDWHW
jgi:hypothetical protein